MSAIISLLVFIACVLLGSALIAWPAHEMISRWTDYPLHKLLGHLTLLLGLAGSMIYLWLNGLLNRDGSGFRHNNQSFLYQIGIGLLLGNVILLVIELALLLLGLHGPEPDLHLTFSSVAKILAGACITGLIVGLLEEIIFRGAIQGVLMKHLPVTMAVFLSSLAYAGLHFIKFPALPADSIPAWHSGLQLLGDAFNKGYFLYNFDKFITLFLLGVLLGTFRALKGNIALCIGIHAGLVMMMKISREWTDYLPGSKLEYLVNNTDHQLGLLSSLVLVTVIMMVLVLRSTIRPDLSRR